MVHKEGKLIIEKAREENAGKYQCNIFNEEKENSVETHEFEIWGEFKIEMKLKWLKG